jgi:hypothetical protein
MMQHIEIQSVTGLPLAHGWSKIISNKDQSVICALAIKGQNAKNAGLEFESELNKTQALAATAVHNLLLDWLSICRDSNQELFLAIVSFNPAQANMTLAAIQGQIFLNRAKKTGQLISADQKIKIIQGTLKPTDTIILNTKPAQTLIAPLKKSLLKQTSTNQLKNIQTQLQTTLNENEDSSLAALALIKPMPIIFNQSIQTAEKKPFQKSAKSTTLTTTPTDKQSFALIEADPKLSKEIKIKISFQPLLKLLKKVLNSALKFAKKIKKVDFKSIEIIKKIRKFGLNFKKSDELYLGQDESKKKSKLVIIVLISVALIYGLWQWRQQATLAKHDSLVTELQPALELRTQAQALLDTDIILAREKTSQALELITAKQKEYQRDRMATKLIELELDQTKNFYEEISGLMEISQLSIFLDLREISSNFVVSVADISDDELILIDQGQHRLISLNIKTKTQQTLSLNENLNIQDFVATTNQIFFLGNGIHTLDFPINENSSLAQVKEPGDSDSEAILIDFFEDYLYVFNPAKRNIYRYIVRDDELSDPIGWLINKQNIEFSQIQAMSIDGQIWLADKQGKITLLEKGEPLEFELQGLNEPLGDTAKIFTKQNYEFLYILEPGKNRLLVLSKQGGLIQQIVSPSLASATSFVVSESQKTGFIFSGSLIYQLDF